MHRPCVEQRASLQHTTAFGIVARARSTLVRVARAMPTCGVLATIRELGARAEVRAGRRQQHRADGRRRSRWCSRSRSWAGALVEETPRAWIVEAGAGETWHDVVRWTLDQGCPGLENLALIPGTVGARAGAEHRRLRRRAAGPLRVARRHRPGHRPQRSRWTRRSAPSATATRVFKHAGPRRRLRPGRPGADHARALSAAQALEAGARLPRPRAQDGTRPASREPDAQTDLRLGLRHPPRQAARPGA